MAIIAAAVGALSVVVGLNSSLQWDTPAGPSIVVAALAGFIISVLPMPKLTVTKDAHTSALKRNFEEVGE
jgi:zinc transport system permease protein